MGGSVNGSVSVRRALEGLRRELARDLEEVRDLAAVAELADEIDELTSDLDRQLERVQEAAVITLVGATGAGKSTLLNALVGRTIASEGVQRPTTAAPVVYRPRDADLRDLLEGLPGEPPEVVDYDAEGGGAWRGQILVDAPDVNSVAALHREVVAALARRSDVLVVVAHRQSISELSSVSFVDAFAGRRGMLFVLNRADELTDAAREELTGQLAELAAERWGATDAPVLAVSARRAKDDPDDPGWRALSGALFELVTTGRLGRVRRLNALGTAGRIGSLFAGLAAAGLRDELDSFERALATGLDSWRVRLERALAERLELRRVDLRAMLWNETARHWEGPGGWALRAGGISTLGLSAGAVLARRNPLLAAGTAVGALAADRVREGVRERSLRDASGLLPGESEREAIYRAELSEARLAAARLAGDPLALGVPGPDELAAAAVAAVDEAWARLLDRDLLAAAQSGARILVRLAVDVPVYTLGAWVVTRAAVGFFTDDYVGFDFLVSAVLILLAWLFLARSTVRIALGGRVRALVASTRAFAGETLAAAAVRVGGVAIEGLRRRTAALERLAAIEDRWRERLLGPPERAPRGGP